MARRVAAEGTVLLVNEGLLPLDVGVVRSVAVIGPNAAQLAMGGGSSEVTPYRRRRVDGALAERLPDASVVSEVGCRIDRGLPSIDLRLLDDETLRTRVFRQPRPRRRRRWRRSRPTPPAVLWIGPPRPELDHRAVLSAAVGDLRARRFGGVATRARERGAGGPAPRRGCRRRQPDPCVAPASTAPEANRSR